jgi:hypothetical protein
VSEPEPPAAESRLEPGAAGPAESQGQPEPAAEPEPAAAAPPGTPDAAEPETALTGTADSAGDESARGISGQVTVVPGIARYHRSQCILIRFLGADDLETMTRKAAEDADLAPCRACQPDKALAGS